MISQTFEIIRRLESGESWSVVTASWNVRLFIIYDMKKQKDRLQLFVASSESLKGLLEGQTMKQPLSVQLAHWLQECVLKETLDWAYNNWKT